MDEIKTINAQELFDKYDEIINITMVNLYTLCKDTGTIVLSDLNRKNKDHLFILRVALLAKDIYNFPLKMRIGLWDWLVLNWKMRKLTHRVPRETAPGPSVNVPGLLEFMYPPIMNYMGEDFRFGYIYDQFYRGDLG